MGVDQVANLVHVAFGQDAAVVDQQDVRGHRLDLVQDVTRDDDVLAGAGPVLDQADGLAPHQRIHAGQGLVQDQQLGVVHQRLRELDALAHALAVGANLLPGGVEQIHAVERARGRGIGVGVAQSVKADERRNPLEPRHAVVEGVLLGTEADARVDARVAPDRLAQHVDGALARLELPGHQLHERGLAGAIRPQQSRDARRNGHGDVVEATHLPVPLRHVIGLNEHRLDSRLPTPDSRRREAGRHVTISTPRTRRCRM